MSFSRVWRVRHGAAVNGVGVDWIHALLVDGRDVAGTPESLYKVTVTTLQCKDIVGARTPQLLQLRADYPGVEASGTSSEDRRDVNLQ